MPYATLAQMTERLGLPLLIALTDRGEVATGVVDASVTDRALTEASDLVDGYVRARYDLPLAEVPGLLVDLTLSIAAWKLYVTDAPAKVTADHDRAIRTLRDIAAGHVRLVGAVGTEPAPSDDADLQVTERDRPFTAETMTGFI